LIRSAFKDNITVPSLGAVAEAMTLVLALPGDDFVVIGADSLVLRQIPEFVDGQVRFSPSKEEDVAKIWRLTDFAGIAYAASDGEVADIYRALAQEQAENSRVTTVKALAEELWPTLRDEFLRNYPQPHSRPEASFLLAGVDSQAPNKPAVLRFGLGNSMKQPVPKSLEWPYDTVGLSKITEVWGPYCYTKSISRKAAILLTTFILQESAIHSTAVGPPFQIVMIDRDGYKPVEEDLGALADQLGGRLPMAIRHTIDNLTSGA